MIRVTLEKDKAPNVLRKKNINRLYEKKTDQKNKIVLLQSNTGGQYHGMNFQNSKKQGFSAQNFIPTQNSNPLFGQIKTLTDIKGFSNILK